LTEVHVVDIKRPVLYYRTLFLKKELIMTGARPLFRALSCLALAFALLSCSGPSDLTLHVEVDRASFVDFDFYATASITATARAKGKPVTISPGDVTWLVESSSITAPWWGNRSPEARNGLSWGSTPILLTGRDFERLHMTGNAGKAPTGATAELTDIVGSRTVTVKAFMDIDGKRQEAAVQVHFGPGPLSVFAGAPKGSMTWASAARVCGGAPGNVHQRGHQPATKLPTMAQLQNVAGSGLGNNGKQGAAYAAGWPDDLGGRGYFCYWTGYAVGGGHARYVFLDDGLNGSGDATAAVPVAACVF
jgi:hypothetical protein